MEIKDLFKNDKERLEKLSREIKIGDEMIYYDYSKTHIDNENLQKYYKIFEAKKEEIAKMKNRENINFTENRKVLHISLRSGNVIKNLKGENVELENEEIEVYNELCKIKEFTEEFKYGSLKGCTGKRINTVVNIGIGGSDLGPRMVCNALQQYKQKDTKVHFITNVDPTDTYLTFEKIDPEETLFLIVSKTFTTLETLTNARLARKLICEKLNKDEKEVSKHHFIAVSANIEKVKEFGIEKRFTMWDYVGGRYSLWSAVGLSISLFVGFDNFLALLEGASIADDHFFNSKIIENIPVLHSIVEIFYNNELNYNNKCIITYDQYLVDFTSYLQQAEMESNGKTATKYGNTDKDTGMIIWGGLGTNSQHSFFQLIHQGTRKILCEFLCSLKSLNDYKINDSLHKHLYSNFVAQGRALMAGKHDNNMYKNFNGNKPTISIVYSKLTPSVLGALIAMYEHKIYLQGLYWNINSFDQFGVELGKVLAKETFNQLNGEKKDEMIDPSTSKMIDLFLKQNK
ncbi:Glucose-6-phosphate isomerase [Spraguea lophii 42_110]|uniref:Glucose-6-phosphate isomerase n=1 Tax=Spraguea lophii (strain 42_110) TaxID=1358809 RepID=S7XQ16_SPRLO|nr:Glucose-6-phosphate isomerase [Spraguea lophii 42_110]